MDDLSVGKGDSSDVATRVISFLNKIGLLNSQKTLFDDEVENSVRAFQQSRGLTVTGVVNAVTLRALDEARWKLGDRSLYLKELPLMR
nr:N-acetylmuramoyl-L-alanine amidase [Actinomycetota bacterium]